MKLTAVRSFTLLMILSLIAAAGAFSPALGSIILEDPPLPTEAEVIYKQFGEDNYAPGQVSLYDLSGEKKSSQAADDFVVPGNQTWIVDRVEPHGLYGYVGEDSPSTQVNVFFYADDEGKPGPEILAEYDLTPDFDWGGTLVLTLSEPLVLSPGRYWVSVQPQMDSEEQGSWFWLGYNLPVGSEFHWRQAQGSYTEWTPSSGIGGASPDLTYFLFGEIFEFLLSGPGQAQRARPGTAAEHVLLLENTKNEAADFLLTLEGGVWDAALSETEISLEANQSITLTVSVEVPLDAALEASDLVTITASTVVSPTQALSQELTTLAGLRSEPALNASPASLAAVPGETAQYSLSLSNLGNGPDTFTLSVEGGTWPAELSQTSLSLGMGEQADLQLSVTVPPGSLFEEADSLTVTATSQGDPGITSSQVITTSAALYADLALAAPVTTRYAAAGQTVQFTLAVTNLGNAVDTFNLAVDESVWSASLSAASLSLEPGESGEVSLSVVLPAQAGPVLEDSAVVTATSQNNKLVSESQAFITRLNDGMIYLPLIRK